MEELMYYVWQQRLFRPTATLAGVPLDVIHPGLRNLDAGPDFFNAKIQMEGVTLAGNVEMHQRSSDWFRHHHDTDAAYNSVILHVVLQADVEVTRPDGSPIHTVVMQIPDDVMQRYQRLLSGTAAPLLPGQAPSYSTLTCSPMLPSVPRLILHDWITALCTQRMLLKMQRVQDLVQGQLRGWAEAFYVVLTRSLGTGVNSDAMERLARSLPYSCLLHHRDNHLQLRALLLGQAGFLQAFDAAAKPAAEQEEWRLMQREYAFLRQKFSLQPLPVTVWRMGRIRPPAQPEARLKALALLLFSRPDLYSQMLEAGSLGQLERLLTVTGLGRQTVRSLIINAAVPTMLSFAQWQGDQERSEQALRLLEELPPEDNRYVALWREAGIEPRSAMDTQALLHLTQHYCQPHKCLRCRIGCWCLKREWL